MDTVVNISSGEPVVEKKFIDIDELIRSKNPSLLKALPRFIIRYLKKVIHQNTLNEMMNKHDNKIGLDFVDGVLADFGVKISVINPENIPYKGRYILAANHPLGGMDALAMMQVVGKTRKDILFPANDLLQSVVNLRPILIPVNKHGRNTENIQVIEETFQSEKLVLYFPAGLCSRKHNGKIYDLEWKNTFIKKAIKHERDIIPVYIQGRNSNFFYNLANFRKRIGIKGNIEMLYLVDEMFKQHDKEIKITFGKPIPFSTFDKKHSTMQWALQVKEHVYSLAANSDTLFDAK
jgi:putative hemolysin